jgi:BirA family biotin operon repressor/biotin-[acetyl-CoA-carboxylase] ligase
VEHLDVAEIISALDPGYWRVHHFNLIDSTQSSLVTAVTEARANAGDVYLAEFQSAGRGRLNRSFASEPGAGVLLSAVIAPQVQEENRWGWVPLIAGVAACAAVFQATGLTLSLKWPNDLMMQGHKVGGILAEKVGKQIVLGVGINCLQSADSLPAPGATSLRLHTSELINRNTLVSAFLNSMKNFLNQWDEKPFPLENKYRQLCSTLEEEVKISLPNGSEVTGRAAAISSEGGLILADGSTFVSADVTHLRLSK